MSEPASLVVRCHIGVDGVREWLASPRPRLSNWSDWDDLEVEMLPEELVELDSSVAVTVGEDLQEIRSWAEAPADWWFSYDRSSQLLTIGQALFTESWYAIVQTLMSLRSIGTYISADHEGGIALVYDWIFQNQATLAAVSLFAGGSKVLPPEDVGTSVEGLCDEVLGPLRDAVSEYRDEPIRDDLEALMGGE